MVCTTDPRYHHNFDPRCHNRFDPRHDGLDLNIQLPDFDVNIPPCPACPSYPQPKPEPEPESKKFLDFSKLAIVVNPMTQDILDIDTRKPTGYNFEECSKIIQNAKNDLQVIDGKLVGSCESDSACNKCVEVINSSTLDSKSAKAFFSAHNGLEPKEPLDISKLIIRVPVGGDDILNARTEKPTGLKAGECKSIVENPKNDLEIVDGRIVGKCYNNPKCDKCVEALNSSIIDSQYEAEPFMSALESTVYVI